jgi:hypothetical protein
MSHDTQWPAYVACWRRAKGQPARMGAGRTKALGIPAQWSRGPRIEKSPALSECSSRAVHCADDREKQRRTRGPRSFCRRARRAPLYREGEKMQRAPFKYVCNGPRGLSDDESETSSLSDLTSNPLILLNW